MTMFDGRTNLSQQVVDEVRGHFGDLAFSTVIPRTVRLSEAPSYGQPITEFDPSSRGARAYQRLARELAGRLELVPEDDRDISPLDALLGGSPSASEPVNRADAADDLERRDDVDRGVESGPTPGRSVDVSDASDQFRAGSDERATSVHVDHPREDRPWQR